jgi:hypothetical protein
MDASRCSAWQIFQDGKSTDPLAHARGYHSTKLKAVSGYQNHNETGFRAASASPRDAEEAI